ncbi:Oidioi.mRNA.OKI2018_I69.XSR.g13518.t1.cds [Oikopleura dioica]|uniref:ribonuclease H n=1 Tax=Oikopleura dioica TaxID=34765 RepID=A0ABN7SAZ3_OIKDI|nr:Oidioi.mRNA.OKI2018_I69.XSR.g13518.t1.cds [Oikopleura dioica]
MPEKVKPLIYHFVMNGADLFLNLKAIPHTKPVEFKKKKLVTRWKRNHANSDAIKKLGGNLKTWYNGRLRLSKFVPKPYEKIGKRFKKLQVASQEAVKERNEEIIDQISKWCKMGSISRLPEASKDSWLQSGFILVDKPGRETRVCLNGGILKPLQLYSFPCKLEAVGTAIQMLKKGDLLYKFDDKKGFHQLPLSEESKKMACFGWGGQRFKNNILAFGLPAAPGIYQLMNLCGVNFLRKNGIKITLYLDDRLLIVSPASEEDRKQLLEGKKISREVWATAATLVALGGFVNIEKSTFLPTQRLEFLGFILDTTKETVEIPPQRWKALTALMEEAQNKQLVEAKLLERIRGTMASMAEVFSNMRLLIRQTTLLIKQADNKNLEKVQLTPQIKAEWARWKKLEEKGLSRIWTQNSRQETGLIIYTDASSHAGAIVIEQWGLEEKFAWEADLADKHICIKEAMAILYAVEWYGPKFENKRILFLCDNDSVVQGIIAGSKDLEMNDILVRIWEIAQRFNIDLKCDWVSTKKQLADAPSRIIDSREQRLTANGFAYLQSHLTDALDVDVAATILNSKCKDFISRRESKGALGADFLSFPIHKLMGRKLYAFPPQAVAFRYFKRLTEIPTPWVLLVAIFETETAVIAEARSRGYRIFDLPSDSILTPAKIKKKARMAERQNVLSMVKEHLAATQHDSKTRATRFAITQAEYDAAKDAPEASGDIQRLQLEIDDIRGDLAMHDSITDELIAEMKTLVENRERSIAIKAAEPNARKRTAEENQFYDKNNPKEIAEVLEKLSSKKMERYNAKSGMLKAIKIREAEIADLTFKKGDSAATHTEVDPVTGKISYFKTQVAAIDLNQHEGENIDDMGRLFRQFVTDPKKQRSFKGAELLELLRRYKEAMGPEHSAKPVVTAIIDTLIKMPDMPRRNALLRCSSLMTATTQHDFDYTLSMNWTTPHHKKWMQAAMDGSEDWRNNGKDGNNKKGRRGGFNDQGTYKKQRTDQPNGQKTDQSEDQKGKSGRGRGREMTWLEFEHLKEIWDVTEALTNPEAEEADDESTIQNFLDRLLDKPKLKAYAYGKGVVIIQDVAASKLKKPLTSKLKRQIKLWCERRARESAKESLQFPKQAEVLDEPEAVKLWDELMETNKPKPREVAVAFFVTYVTGARMGEALSLRIEDRSIMKEAAKEFWRFHIRSSKTDPFCKRMETLNIPMNINHGVPLAEELRHLVRDKNSGLLFPLLDEKTSIAGDYLRRYSDKARIGKKVSAHSGRVSFYIEGRRAGQSQSTLTHTMRWAPGSAMPDYYERCWLECTDDGAPAAIAEARAAKRRISNHSEAESPAQSDNEQGEGITKRARTDVEPSSSTAEIPEA